MNDTEFILAHALICFAFLVVGLIALLVPQSADSSVIGRLWPAGKSGGGGREYQRRLVGLILALFGFFPLKSDLLSIFEPRLSGHLPRVRDRALQRTNPAWLPFLMGLLVVGVGSFVLRNPGPLVPWSQQRLFPERRIPEGALRTWRMTLRVAGALMIYASVGLFRLWTRR